VLARYLGKKTAVMSPLIETVKQYASPGDRVVDGFSGSLSVSMALKANDFRVTANDINLFSATFADAYLIPMKPPSPELSDLLSSARISEMLEQSSARVETLSGQKGFKFLEVPEWRASYTKFFAVLLHLQHLCDSDVPKEYRSTHIFDTYCEEGKNSDFTSARGTKGRRRFFTPSNASKIDLIANQLRAWHMTGAIDQTTYSACLSSLVRAIEKISNTQGTYHDFIRDHWDSRALNPLIFDPPQMDDVVAGVDGHSRGREQDTIEFVKTLDDHEVLYLDPPYNFRQYSSYYFLPNLICRYPEMEDPGEYFSNVKFVRGQNPNDGFVSTFCKASSFIGDLRKVIENARCRTVIISYFDGANHWSSFDTGSSDVGLTNITALLNEPLFEPGSFRAVRVPRRNYASYGGYTARNVTELILIAQKLREFDNASLSGAEGRLQLVA